MTTVVSWLVAIAQGSPRGGTDRHSVKIIDPLPPHTRTLFSNLDSKSLLAIQNTIIVLYHHIVYDIYIYIYIYMRMHTVSFSDGVCIA